MVFGILFYQNEIQWIWKTEKQKIFSNIYQVAGTSITLRMVKSYLPKKDENYAFFFKYKYAGEVIEAEMRNESNLVPMFDGQVLVEVRRDTSLGLWNEAFQ